MPSALAFIGGGLLQGVGKGLAEQGRETGKAKYEAALADLEHKRTLERDEKQLEGRRGLLTQQLSREDERQARGDTAAGERRVEASRSAANVANIGAASREKVATIGVAGTRATDTSAAEKRFWDIAVETATKFGVDKDGEPSLIETTDWNAVVLDMEARNLPELAVTARRRARADQERQDREVALPIAQERVKAMVSLNPFTTDAEDFKEYDGSQTKALDAILREEMKKLADARSGKAAPTTRPAGGDPDVGEGQQARRGKDGLWYIPDPDRAGDRRPDGGVFYMRVAPPAPQQRPAVDPQTTGPSALPRPRTRIAPGGNALIRPGAGAVADKPIKEMTMIEIADLIQSRGDSLTPEQLGQVTQRLQVLRRARAR